MPCSESPRGPSTPGNWRGPRAPQAVPPLAQREDSGDPGAEKGAAGVPSQPGTAGPPPGPASAPGPGMEGTAPPPPAPPLRHHEGCLAAPLRLPDRVEAVLLFPAFLLFKGFSNLGEMYAIYLRGRGEKSSKGLKINRPLLKQDGPEPPPGTCQVRLSAMARGQGCALHKSAQACAPWKSFASKLTKIKRIFSLI